GEFVALLVAAVVLEGLEEFLLDLFAAVGPDVEELVVAFAGGDDAAVEVALDAVDLLLGLGDEFGLLLGDAEVGDAEGEAGDGGLLEADLLHAVEQIDGAGAAAGAVAVVDDAGAALLAQGAVVEGHAGLEDLGEEDAADGGDDAAARREGDRVA